MPTASATSIPLNGTLWQTLQSSRPAGLPWAAAPAPAASSTDQSWLTRLGIGSVPSAGLSFSPVSPRPAPYRQPVADYGIPGFIGAVGATINSMSTGWVSTNPASGGSLSSRLGQRLGITVNSARRELAMGVRESGGANRGARIDQYARTVRMDAGQMWCGFFVGFNYAQAGLSHPEHFASVLRARRFFLYQDDNQSSAQRAQGSTRKFFTLPESRTHDYLRGSHAPNYDERANTFNWWNLPIRAGDSILFDKGPNYNGHPTHIGLVESYDPATGRLVTIEGNVDNRVVRKSYDLTNASVRRDIAGFGRPADGDFA